MNDSTSRMHVLPYALALTLTSFGAACSGTDPVIGYGADAAGDDQTSSGVSSGTGSGDTSGSTGSSGDTSGSSGSDPDAMGPPPMGDAGGGTPCPPQTSLVQGVHVKMDVAIGGTTSNDPGNGKVDVWLLMNFTKSGEGSLVGSQGICGVSVPADTLNLTGQIATGGNKILITLPTPVWNGVAMVMQAPATKRTFPLTATVGRWAIGGSVNYSPVLSLLGLRLTNPDLAWPAHSADFPTDTTFPDDDGDGKPGITATMASGNGYVLPPTKIGPSSPRADKVYVAQRSEFTLKGTFTTCDEVTGSVAAKYFDSRVIGCHDVGAQDCVGAGGVPGSEVDQIDTNTPPWTPMKASFDAKALPATAKCSDVLAMFPAQ